MAATVVVNFMTVVHRTSNGINQAFPDVCKTPAAPSPVPIPYPNIAMSSDAADTASSVEADGNPIMISTSKYAMSTGDEAGSLLGVVSNKIKGSANPQMWSFDVKAEGKNVFRQLDIMLQNGNTKPDNAATGPTTQPPESAMAEGEDPEKFKIIEVKWTNVPEHCKCGDPVKIETKTENFDDGDPVPHTITRSKRRTIDNTQGEVKGNSVTIDWLTLNGPWQKDVTKLKAKATGKGGPKETDKDLEIEVPAEKENKYNDTIVQAGLKRVQVKVKGVITTNIQPVGKNYRYYRRYTISIKQGIFKVLSKIKIEPVKPIKFKAKQLRKWKKSWKNEIETVWNRTWKEHRDACKRGGKCKCPGGCCLFPIHVICKFVNGGADHTVKLHPGRGRHNASTWYTAGGTGPSPVVHAHEFGHVIGMADEYSGAATISPFVFAPKSKDYKSSVMAVGSLVFQRHWTSHPDGGRSIHKWFLDAAGEAYKVSKIASS